MIELLLAFMAGLVYALAGISVTKRVDPVINLVMLEKGLNPSWGIYVSFMVTLLWPVLGALIVFTTAYATLKSKRA